MAYRAFIQPMFSMRGVKLLVAEDWAPGTNRILMSDATWREMQEGASNDQEGIILPFDALSAIEDAISLYRGQSSHAATESKVLREALDIERRRVDDVLKARNG